MSRKRDGFSAQTTCRKKRGFFVPPHILRTKYDANTRKVLEFAFCMRTFSLAYEDVKTLNVEAVYLGPHYSFRNKVCFFSKQDNTLCNEISERYLFFWSTTGLKMEGPPLPYSTAFDTKKWSFLFWFNHSSDGHFSVISLRKIFVSLLEDVNFIFKSV